MAKKHQNVSVNEIDETVAASKSFVEKHKNVLMYGIGGVVAAVIICLLTYQYYIVPRNIKAAESLAVSEQLFRAGQYEKALNGDGTNPGFLQVADEFGCTKSANLAKLYAGLCYNQLGKYQEAVDCLEDFSGCGDEMVSNAALIALGNSYAELGQNEKGAETLVKAAKNADNTTISPVAYLQAGQLYEAAGNKEKALECYQAIKDNYKQSYQFQEIDKYIERIK